MVHCTYIKFNFENMLKDYLNYNSNNSKSNLIVQTHRIIFILKYNNNTKNIVGKVINKYINKRKVPANFKLK